MIMCYLNSVEGLLSDSMTAIRETGTIKRSKSFCTALSCNIFDFVGPCMCILWDSCKHSFACMCRVLQACMCMFLYLCLHVYLSECVCVSNT